MFGIAKINEVIVFSKSIARCFRSLVLFVALILAVPSSPSKVLSAEDQFDQDLSQKIMPILERAKGKPSNSQIVNAILWLKPNGQIVKILIKGTPVNKASEQMFYSVIGKAQPIGELPKSYHLAPYLRICASYSAGGQCVIVEHLDEKSLNRWLRQLNK